MEVTLERLSMRVAENMTSHDNDFINDDGLLCCGVCGTPKQVKICILGKYDIKNCICKCEQEKDKIIEQLKENARHTNTVDELRTNAFPTCKNPNSTNDMKTWTFENDKGYNPVIMQIAKDYVNKFENFRRNGLGIIFYSGFEDGEIVNEYGKKVTHINGGVGVGKSYVAACIANALIDREIPVLMTDFATIYNTAFPLNDKQSYYDSFNKYPLLIIDDLMAERDSSHMKEVVLTVINNRINAGLPIIVTTNLTGKQIKQPFSVSDQRIFSRLAGCCQLMFVQGEDLRQRKMMELFGRR
ncbi:MAG: ATP-binding protein [Ruminococcus flavefaciens]|nr:ATP-binding protein [Ruminococcus flavefaciens]